MDKVMWAYQARQVRTWYWSSPVSFLEVVTHYGASTGFRPRSS
jgi:hypothetical protein